MLVELDQVSRFRYFNCYLRFNKSIDVEEKLCKYLRLFGTIQRLLHEEQVRTLLLNFWDQPIWYASRENDQLFQSVTVAVEHVVQSNLGLVYLIFLEKNLI